MTEIQGKSILVRISANVRVSTGSSYRESTVIEKRLCVSSCSKAFSRIIFSVIFRASNRHLVAVKEIKLKSNFNSNLALTLGYLNPTLNNSAQEV